MQSIHIHRYQTMKTTPMNEDTHFRIIGVPYIRKVIMKPNVYNVLL